jgi:7-cyano-7-deazaguanine synthase
MQRAVVLFSGGLDSTTCLALAKSKGFDCYALSFHYGQRHVAELNAAKEIALHYKVAHKIFIIDIQQFGGSALTNMALDIPAYHEQNEVIPLTYVPARNTIFLSIALAWAEVLNAKDIFIGVSAVDYSGYPDCRPEYIQAFQRVANLAAQFAIKEGGVTLHAPLIHLSKAETIRLGTKLGVNYAMTISCYQANQQGEACGQCDSCALRKKGFVEAEMADTTLYAAE